VVEIFNIGKLHQNFSDSVEDAVADLNVSLLDLDAVDLGTTGQGDLQRLAEGCHLSALLEVGGLHLTRDDMVLEDVGKVGEVLQLKLGDSQLLCGSGECIIIGSKQGELGIGVHEGLVKASGRDQGSQQHVVGVFGDGAIDGAAI
jgi:hypothetical protein